MANRRASERLSGGSNDGLGEVARNGVVTNTKKRMTNGVSNVAVERDVDAVFGMGEPEKKKRKKEVKTKPAFKPQPVKLPNSSSTPPDDDPPINIPPPPSEKRIARRRESTKAIRERDKSESPSHQQPAFKIQKTGVTGNKSTKNGKARGMSEAPGLEGGSTLADELGGERGRWNDAVSTSSKGAEMSSHAMPHLEFLNFGTSQKVRPSAPRPISPPRQFNPTSISQPSASSSKMLPPPVPLRKSRQSVRGGMEFSTDSMQPVPISDTPVIRKNQEMRKEAQRRSSLGMRGQRASSSLGRGEISIPHGSVPTETFYKHIAPTIPEPIRARHLLIWCAKRAADEATSSSEGKTSSGASSKTKDKAKNEKEVSRSSEGDKLVQQIMDDFMSNLGRGAVDTNVFAVADDASFTGQLRLHPANVANRELEAKEEGIVKKARTEDAQWTSLVRRANAKQSEVIPQLQRKRAENIEPDMSKADEWMKKALEIADEVIGEGEGDLSSMGEFADVEFKIDMLHQTSHAALQYSLSATKFLDGIFSSLATDLRNRENVGTSSSSVLPVTDSETPDTVSLLATTRQVSTAITKDTKTTPRDPINMLRALAAAEAKYQSDDTVTVAAGLQPVSTSTLASSVATPRRPVGMTPRRPGTAGGVGVGTTPRRQAYGKATETSAE